MLDSPVRSSRPYGPYRGNIKDNLYLLQYGHIHTSPYVVAKGDSRFFARVSLTVDYSEFALTVRGYAQRYRASAVRANSPGLVVAKDVPFIVFSINPFHKYFRAFCSIPNPGVLAFERSKFENVDKALNAAYHGNLSIVAASELHDHVLSIIATSLPCPKPMDHRIQIILDHVDVHPESPLEELARVAGLSYKRVSLLFGRQVGLPLKSYLLWKKLHRYELLASIYGASRSITEIAHAAGFVDSAHVCRTVHEISGAPPSYFFANQNVRVFSWLRQPPMAPAPDGSFSKCRTASDLDQGAIKLTTNRPRLLWPTRFALATHSASSSSRPR